MSWLVVGLGNPGAKYERNRHNIGFHVVDELARKGGFPAWKSGKLGGDTTSGSLAPKTERSGPAPLRGDDRCVLVKPMEFMNLSGFATQRAAQFHSIDVAHIVVVHDELDLDFGIVRLKLGGGHGGHNGLRSIIEQLGTPEFCRVRMGIGRDPNKPPGSKDAAGWVLSDFPAAQAKVLSAVISAGCDAVEAILTDGMTKAMNRQNARPNLATP